MSKDEPQRLILHSRTIPLGDWQRDPRDLVASALSVNPGQVLKAAVIRRAIDARRRKPRLVLELEATLASPLRQMPPDVSEARPEPSLPPPTPLRREADVAVIGTGPAGLFAAFRLTQAGLRPIVLERGPGFPERHAAIEALQARGALDPEANFHFGLGGAGTYSDGKLYTRTGSPALRSVMELLVACGAGSRDELLVEAQPHVGTDRWPQALERLRALLEERGCRFVFRSRVVGLHVRQGRLVGLALADGALACEACLLAPGNSARDLFEALEREGVPIEAKAFAVGVRMTHPQALIDGIQYGREAGHPALGPASYRLTAKAGGRGVYSFCMCPGGLVVPTPTEPDGLALNGMSNSGRDSGEANAAVVTGVSENDFGAGPLAGIAWQRRLERAAALAGGGACQAPAQRLVDFLAGRKSGILPTCRYRPGVRSVELDRLLSVPLADALRQGLQAMCRKVPGLADPRSVLLGLETRTSSPVRIVRGPDGMSPGAAGLFPAGEGAGYAGGISSSAVDGLRQADALVGYLAGRTG